MTSDTLLRIELCQPVGVGWIIKLAGWVRILGRLELCSVALRTSVLLDAHELRVARVTGKFNLVVAMRCLTG